MTSSPFLNDIRRFMRTRAARLALVLAGRDLVIE